MLTVFLVFGATEIIFLAGVIAFIIIIDTNYQKKRREKRELFVKNNFPNAYAEYWGTTVYIHSQIVKTLILNDNDWKALENKVIKEREEAREANVKKYYPEAYKEYWGKQSSTLNKLADGHLSDSEWGILEDEMESLIESARTEAEETKRQEENHRRMKEQAKALFEVKVKSWSPLFNHFYYTWLLYYYPTTCTFEANEQEWLDRYTVWFFKNDPNKRYDQEDYKEIINNIISRIKQRLTETFGQEYLQFLTFVCVPASTKAKHVARYKEFSKRLCEETGMQNGYDFIQIVKDGLSKKDPTNTTGHSIQPEVFVDDQWFKGRSVLLFDDVVTKGNTMLRYKLLLERKGATVIGGMCIGKTKHERFRI